jgi:YbbR domain-containing protein
MMLMARWFANNVGLMILAVILAFFVWALASLQGDPILENTISAPVVVMGQPPAGEILSASTLPGSVSVRIRAPQSVFETLSNTVQVPVDLSQLGPGEHVVELTPAINAQPSLLLSSRPNTATVTIENTTRQPFPVKVSLTGTPAIGYRTLAPVVASTEAIITGTSQVVTQVVTLEAIVNVDNVRSAVEQTVSLVARDAAGNAIDGLNISPSTVSVRVPVEQLSNYRDLAVRVKITGQPANGYAVTNVEYTPQVVTVFGPREAIQQLPGFIETLDFSIDKAKQTVEQRVGLNVPPNVSLVSENQSVAVRVQIDAQQGARTVSRRLTVTGVATPFTSNVSPQSIDIVLAGPLPLLNQLAEEDVRVEVDAADLPAGVHQVAPTVIVPEGITVQSILPATVQVEIK